MNTQLIIIILIIITGITSHYLIMRFFKPKYPPKYPIALTEQEVKWIKLLKGHYKDKYLYTRNEWTDILMPMFEEIYGYSPVEHYNDYLNCMFNKLLDIHSKIATEHNFDREIKDIFNASFYKSIPRQQERPIERAISELCGIIQGNIVIDGGVVRYKLD